jgi:hypothetical protein
MSDPSMLPTYAIAGIIIIGVMTILPLGAALLLIGTWTGRVQTTAMNAEKAAELARERAHDLANQALVNAMGYIPGACDSDSTLRLAGVNRSGRTVGTLKSATLKPLAVFETG